MRPHVVVAAPVFHERDMLQRARTGEHYRYRGRININQAVNNPTFRLTWRIEYDSPAV
jgi:hypothetical protein